MKTALFYGIATVASLGAIAGEAWYSRVKRRGWYSAKDAATNLNIGAGNVLAGLVLVVLVEAGYAALLRLRIADVPARLPAWSLFPIAIVFADFLQYWNHRLSHRVNVLWAGHITHHSSQHLNLSTGIRINWLYRSYAWLLYAPMPLLGFPFETFVAGLAVISTYNLFMHTRMEVPFGPLGRVLVTPAAHRLHHSADPRYHGNYGAALIVWDRLFGTYRERPSHEAEALTFGIGRGLGTSPLALNFHYIAEMWNHARAGSASFARLLFSTEAVPAENPSAGAGDTRVPFAAWVALALVAAMTILAQRGHESPLAPAQLALVCGGLGLVTWLGARLLRDAHDGTVAAPFGAARPALQPGLALALARHELEKRSPEEHAGDVRHVGGHQPRAPKQKPTSKSRTR